MKLVYKCRECGSPFVTEKGLSEHLASSHQIQPKEYYDKYVSDGTEGKCAICGTPTKFISMGKGYYKTCPKCKNELVKENSEPQEKKCEECGFTITGNTASILGSRFHTHIKKHGLSQQQYYDKYDRKPGEGFCEFCGKPTNFDSLNRGYYKCCNDCKTIRASKKRNELVKEEQQFQAEVKAEKKSREEVYAQYVQSLKDEVNKYEWEGERNSWMGGNRTRPNPNRNDLLTDNSISYIDGQRYSNTTDYIDESDNQSFNDVFWL